MAWLSLCARRTDIPGQGGALWQLSKMWGAGPRHLGGACWEGVGQSCVRPIPPLAPCAVLTVCSAVVPPLTVRSAVVPLIPHTPPGESSVFGWDGVSSSLKMPLPGTVRPGHVSLSQGRVCGRAVGASDSKGSG